MLNSWEIAAGVSSTIVRLGAFVFLRWIPGHHFPPLIITTLATYLAVVYFGSEAFGTGRPKLRNVFPALFKHKEIEIVHDDEGDVVEVAEVEYNDPVLYEDEHPYIKTVLCGIPDWHEWEFSFLTIGLNLLLATLTLDLVFRGPLFHPAEDLRFSRVGHVDESTAKLLFREPESNQLPVYTYFKTDDAANWQEADRTYYVGAETDYTRTITLTGLSPESSYQYSMSNGLNGTFLTAPTPSSPRAGSLTFLTSSCIKANFPYRPFSHSLAIHGFEHLSRLLRSLPSTPAFMLFLGDFIYVDVPQRLSSSFSHYRSEYRRVYASPSWKLPGLTSLPWIHTLDDHEIANDWSGGNETAPFPAASDPFIHYHVSANPPVPPSAAKSPESNTTYFQFTRGPASFFMLDTRRYRTNPEEGKQDSRAAKPLYGSSDRSSNPPNASEQPASMLGPAQLSALLMFLSTSEPAEVHWKIIASSVPFTKNWRFGTSDTWGGFPTERNKILAAMHEAESTLGIRIIILSGDRHEFAAIRFPPPIAQLNPATTSSKLDNRISGTLDRTSIGKTSKNIITTPTTTVYDRTPQSGPHEFSVGPLSMFYLPIRTFKQIDEEDVAIAYFPDGNSKVGVVEIHNLVSPAAAAVQQRPKTTGFRFGDVLFGRQMNRQDQNTGAGGVYQRSLFKYSLWIDGKVHWEYTLTSPGPRFGIQKEHKKSEMVDLWS